MNKYILFLLSFLFHLSIVRGQQFQFQNYSVGDGLAQSQVYSILEDSKGYIWMGTRGGGISKYDGFKFTQYTTKQGLAGNYIWTLFEDSQHRIWIGTGNGITVYEDSKFTNYTSSKKNSIVASVITENNENQVVIGSNDGVHVFQDSTIVPYQLKNVPNDEAVSVLCYQESNEFWVGGDNGIFRSNENITKHFSSKNGLNSNLIRALAIDSKKQAWVGTYGKGVNIIRHDTVLNANKFLPLANTSVSSIICDSEGQVWISTIEKGICRFNPKDSSYVLLSESEGLANNHTRTIIEDRWGNYWMGTSGGGVSKYTGQQFEYFSTSAGLPGNYIYSIQFDEEDKMWLGTSGLGVTKLDTNGYTTYKLDSGFANVKVKSICHGIDGLLWLGTDGQGLYYFDGDTFQNLNTSNGLSGNWVKDIEEDDEGNIWVATSGGGITKISIFHSFKQKRKVLSDTNANSIDSATIQEYDTVDYVFSIDRFNTQNGLSSNRINQIHFDGYGRCWYATQANGLGVIVDDTIFKSITTSTHQLKSNNIRSICEDTYGHLWIGTAGKGIHKLTIYTDSLTLEVIDSEQGLQSDNVYQLIVDTEDNLWVGSEKGVDQLKLNKEGNVIEIKHFGKNDGFIGVETSLNAIATDTLGNTWFGTINGLSKFTPGNNITNLQPPVLSFTNVELNYVPIDKSMYFDKTMELKYNKNQITFDFIGIMQTNPEKVKYQWKLSGLEEDWSPPSSKRSITYSNLSPLSYVFQVRAANENEIWSDPIEIKFNIRPPIWKEWWFITAGILIILTTLAGIIWLRFNVVKKKAAREKQQIVLEKELLQLEQKALRLQMNPHFIFNALNTIQALVSSNDSKTARYYLAKFSKLMRQILDNSRQTTIPLEHEIVTLENYLSIEKFCHNNRFDFELSIDNEVDVEEVEIPPMLLQPFIENAIIHGVSQVTNQGMITVSFQKKKDVIVCQVKDNGIGRKRALEMKSQRDQHHKSTALIVTQERLDILNDGQEKMDSILIEDLYDEENCPSGTLVTLSIRANSG